MRALVTGGGGFLGSSIVRMLLQDGHQVRVLARSQYPELKDLGVEMVQGDITDLESVISAAKDCDSVFHVAAKAGIWGAFSEYYRINVEGTKNVYMACVANRISRLVYSSSPSVVFDGRDMEGANESVPYPKHYEAHYPYTKAIAEQFILQKNATEGVFTCALRPHLIWGEGDNHLIPRILKRARNKQLRIVGNGKNLVDCVFVDNAARAHILACEKLTEGSPVCGRAYFIANDEPMPLFDWMNEFVVAAGMPRVSKKVPVALAWTAGSILESIYKSFGIQSEPRMTRFLAAELGTAHWFDLSAAKRDFGYCPEVSNQEGFQRVFASEWWRALSTVV